MLGPYAFGKFSILTQQCCLHPFEFLRLGNKITGAGL